MNARKLLAVLSEKPDRRWPEGVLHHGVRVLLLVVLAATVATLFPVSPVSDSPPVERGGVLEEDVVAEVPFPIYKTEAELAREQEDAAAGVNAIFVYDSTAVDSMLADVDQFFTLVDSAASSAPPEEAERRIQDLLESFALPDSPDEVEILLDARTRAQLERTVREAILEELPRGIARSGELEETGSGRIRLLRPQAEQVLPVDSVLQLSDFYDRSRLYVPPGAPSGYEQLQRLLLVRFNLPSIRPDRAATEAARERARAVVNPVKTQIMRGQRIVPAREPVTEADLERYRAYQQELERLGQAGGGRSTARAAGGFLFDLIMLSLFGVLLFFFRPDVYHNLRHIAVLAGLIVTVVAIASLIGRYHQPIALIPIAFPALVVAILWDGRLALNLSLIIAILLSGQPPFLGIVALTTLVTTGAVASLSVRVVRRRAQIWGFIGLIVGAYVLVSVVLGLLRGWPLLDLGVYSGWGVVTAVASAFAAMGFLPILESFTRITTDQTLLELADVNRPLLRRLSLEAPGTYAHSISVANLAEAAAGAIGANALLTRVGVYYHDVGKMERPHYFIENQPSGRNPHDKLKPATSAQVVRNHVVEGLRMAEEAKLPACLKDFILEHHGTQSISFFYDQAREADPDADLDPAEFCYPGPRPQSPETAIVMLADSVESAARVLPDPSPEKIRELVDRIVRGKMDAGQLDETPLTLRELTQIKEQFVSVLAGMYHQRIDYPPGRERGAPGGPAAGSGPAPQSGPGPDQAAGQAGQAADQGTDAPDAPDASQTVESR